MLIGDYGQEVPPVRPWEKAPGPPILPPHLLQVILNKDTPISVSITCSSFYYYQKSLSQKWLDPHLNE